MNPTLQPSSLTELTAAVRSHPRLIAVGAGTKPRLSMTDAVRLSMLKLAGVIEYQPEEFTFTALAGTTLREISDTLGKCGQYLPFDPLLVESGATIGGTVASGLNGPGRFRFGGLRDFILGIQFVDGAGQLLRAGGKVVKNAAGFDLPKFFTGSLGRFGVLAEITFKVFPRPAARLTVEIPAQDANAATRIFTDAASRRWECDALDLLPDGKTIYLRLAGPAEALAAIAKEILAHWAGRIMPEMESEKTWRDLREFHWTHPDGVVVKIPITPNVWPALQTKMQALRHARVHVSVGGNVAFVSIPTRVDCIALDGALRELGLSGLMLRGTGPLWLGTKPRSNAAQAVKDKLDTPHRFPGLDE